MSSLKALFARLITKKLLKIFSLIYLVMTGVSIFAMLFEGHMNIVEIFSFAVKLLLVFIVLLIGYVFIYAAIEFDTNSHEVLDYFIGKAVNGIFKLVSIILKFIFICAVAYGVFYILGGIIGVLKFGWSQL